MRPDEIGFVLLFLGAVLALPTGILGYIILTDDGAGKRFNATPRQPIRTAQPGGETGDRVKIIGRAAASPPLVAPFSGRDVVWYVVVVNEHEHFLDGTTLRERITRHLLESSRAPFTITDDSGASARIVVDGEEIFPHAHSEVTDVGAKGLPARIQKALDERGVASRTKGGEPKRLRCVERWIAPDDTVIAIGPARRALKADAEPSGYRGAPTELVVGERGPGEKRMFVLSVRPESELDASDRKFLRIAWALGITTAGMLGVGAWLCFG